MSANYRFHPNQVKHQELCFNQAQRAAVQLIHLIMNSHAQQRPEQSYVLWC
jgi:hypothetical protein